MYPYLSLSYSILASGKRRPKPGRPCRANSAVRWQAWTGISTYQYNLCRALCGILDALGMNYIAAFVDTPNSPPRTVDNS
jgi:hypothetical protein